ncbi:hypothetical protein [Photorhabdus tasmaniensis]|uniref:Uncharacterized protein n=1 Tax=Photorhabdus tasmaniensis TaxID=1004159 RepID=A0ABX0GIT5_9GAMM|nr:hypothetical protein [Photorhabdus tasmaniensis]NHB88121.1 hypothetical protein [Photorhabdus tasmaniensis]
MYLQSISINLVQQQIRLKKPVLSKPKSENHNPRIDTLDAIAITTLHLPLDNLPGGNKEQHSYLEKRQSMKGDYTKNMKFQVGLGNVTKIYYFKMNLGAAINSPDHIRYS